MADTWSLQSLWNAALDMDNHRPYEPRQHIYASELGGSYYDRYFKMKGRKPTTPPNLRVRRKFEGGNLTEWIVQQILKRAGILTSSQEYITYDGLLRVTGRADFTAGGKIQPIKEEDLLDLPETFQILTLTVMEALTEKYRDGLRDMNLEIKSCSGMIFDRYTKAPSLQHGLQAFHYAFNTKRPTMLVYVSRDDFRIAEWVILPGSRKWRQLYDEDISMMFNILGKTKMAVREEHKELLLTWDGKEFNKNWKIEYSNYLTDYGFKKPDEYAKPAQSCKLRLNNIVKRINADKPIDGKVNLKTLTECYAFYPEAEQIINKLQEQ